MEKVIKCYCGHTTTCDCGPKEETLEEAAERLAPASSKLFIEGAKWQMERMYSEEEVDKMISDFKHDFTESKMDYVKHTCSGAIFGLSRLKNSKKK